LAKLAWTSFEQMSEDDRKKLSPQEAELYTYLAVTVGQTRKLTGPTGKPGVLLDNEKGELKKLLGRELSWRQAVLAAAVGDYAQAAKLLAEIQPPPIRPARPPLAEMLQAASFGGLPPHPLGRLTMALLVGQQYNQAALTLARQSDACNFLVLRGLVALDEGDTAAAKKHFREAVSLGNLVPFESRPIAVRYLELLEEKRR
jgi:hypothetical protein